MKAKKVMLYVCLVILVLATVRDCQTDTASPEEVGWWDGNKGYITESKEEIGLVSTGGSVLRIYTQEDNEPRWYNLYVDKEGEMFIESNKGFKISLSELVELLGLIKEQFNMVKEETNE